MKEHRYVIVSGGTFFFRTDWSDNEFLGNMVAQELVLAFPASKGFQVIHEERSKLVTSWPLT